MRRLGLLATLALALILPVLALSSAAGAAPTISSFTPAKGALGTVVTVTGSGFTGAASVKFGGVAAKFTVVSDTLIHATVPTLAATGKITIGTASSTSTFTVLAGVAVSPAAGAPTSTVIVSGSGFGATELVDIYEGTIDMALATTDSSGRFWGISLAVSASAPPGALWVTAAGRHSQLAAQKAFVVRTDWLNPRRDSRASGWNRYENTLNVSTIRNLAMLWTTNGANFLSNGPPGVIYASGLIVTSLPVRSLLVALRVDGTQAWSQPLNTSYFSSPAPSTAGGIVVQPSTDGKVHAFTLATGAPKWTTPGPSDTGNGAAVIVGHLVLAPGATTLQALDLTTGLPQWSYTGPCTSNLSTPAISAATILFTCTNSSGGAVLVSLGLDGTFYHWFSVAAGTTGSPAIDGGNVYLLLGGNLIGYSLSAFNPKWTIAPPFSVFADPAAGDGIVATCGGGGIWVVNAASGTTRFANASYACSAPVTIANGVIYEPRNGDIVMFDEYGDVLARLGSGGNVGPVTVADGSVYAADSIAGVDRWGIPAPASASAEPPPKPWQLYPDRKLTPTASNWSAAAEE